MPCLSELVIDCIICGVQLKCSKVNLPEVQLNTKWALYFCELLAIEGENLQENLPNGFYCPHCYSKIRTVATVSDLMEKMIGTLKEMKAKLEDELYLGNVHLTNFSDDEPDTVEKSQNKLRVQLFQAYEKKLEREKQAAILQTKTDEETQTIPEEPNELTTETPAATDTTLPSSTQQQSSVLNPVNKLEKTAEDKNHLVKIRLPRNITKQVLNSLMAQSENNNEDNQLVIQGFVKRSSPTTVTETDATGGEEIIELEGQNGLTVLDVPETKTNIRSTRKSQKKSSTCNICQKIFSSDGYLKRHMKAHETSATNSPSNEQPVAVETESLPVTETNLQIVEDVAMEVVVDTTDTIVSPEKTTIVPQQDTENPPSAKRIKLATDDDVDSKPLKLGSKKSDKKKPLKKGRRSKIDKLKKSQIAASTQTLITRTATKSMDSIPNIKAEVMTSPLKATFNVNQHMDNGVKSSPPKLKREKPVATSVPESPVATRKSTRARKQKV